MGGGKLKTARLSRQSRSLSRKHLTGSSEPVPSVAKPVRTKNSKSDLPSSNEADTQAAHILMTFTQPISTADAEKARDKRLDDWVSQEINRHAKPKEADNRMNCSWLFVSITYGPVTVSLSSSSLSDIVCSKPTTVISRKNSPSTTTKALSDTKDIGVQSKGDEENDSDPGTFDIRYEVTIKKARIDFVLDNTTAFDIFRQNVASQMGVPLQSLSALGYTVSFWPRSPKPLPKPVDTDARYEDMIEELEEYMKVELTKKGQPKKKKAFSVLLADTSIDDSGKKDGKKVSDRLQRYGQLPF